MSDVRLQDLRRAVLGVAGIAAYAVIDGARDARIEKLLGLWGLEHACLEQDAGPQLRNASAFLVRLDARRDETDLLLERAWGRAWGIFALAPAALATGEVLAHVRRLGRTLLPDGRMVLFRWFDPRVLHAMLPACTDAEIARLLGPLRALLLETPEGTVRRIDPPGVEAGRGRFVISPAMLAALEAASLRRLAERLAPSIGERLADSLSVQGIAPDAVHCFVVQALQAAWGFGIRAEDDLEGFVELAAVLGAGFPDDPAHPWAATILRNATLTGTAKVALLLEQAIFRGLAA